jgi:DNA-binding transcriptional LysR family regulator
MNSMHRRIPRQPSFAALRDHPEVSWIWLRSLVAVVNTGSLSAAARAIKATQPTIGRHIRALERQLGETLFDRRPDGLLPTARGTEIYERAAAVDEAITGLTSSIGSQSPEVSGVVRITSSLNFTVELLPALLSPLLRENPRLQIELIPSDEVRNLLRREADLAVRLVRPTQPEVIASKVGRVTVGLYAHRDYLARCGIPRTASQFANHDLIGYQDVAATVMRLAEMGLPISPAQVRIYSENLLTHVAMLRAGCGIGACEVWLADRHPELRRVMPRVDVATWPVWIAAHDDLHRSRRFRLVFDYLSDRLRETLGSVRRAAKKNAPHMGPE